VRNEIVLFGLPLSVSFEQMQLLKGVLLALSCVVVSGQVPRIRDLSPFFGRVGDQIKIKGENYSEILSSNAVFFAGVKAVVRAASATELDVEVPRGVVGGPVTVTVNGYSCVSPILFQPKFERSDIGTNSFYAIRKIAPKSAGPCITADLDGDGLSELVAPGVIYQPRSERGLLTTNSLRAIPAVPVQTVPVIYRVTAMDYDSDGKTDLLFPGNFRTPVLRNIHVSGELNTNSFVQLNDYSPRVQAYATDDVYDIDGDGRLDLITCYTGFEIHKNIFNSGSTNIFAAPIRFHGFSHVEGSDLNRDGRAEIVAVASNVTIFAHIDAAGVIKRESFAEIILPRPHNSTGSTWQEALGLADLDSDGYLDIVTTTGLYLTIFMNRTFGGPIRPEAFVPILFSQTIDKLTAPLFGLVCDFDGDAKPDLYLGGNKFLRNMIESAAEPDITPNSFTAGPRLFKDNRFYAIKGRIELTGDGAPEIIFGDNLSSGIWVLENLLPTAPSVTGITHKEQRTEMNVIGFPNQALSFEYSSDLRQWSPMSETVVIGPDGEKPYSIQGTGPSGFFRLQTTVPK
jgi:hypothetical protein